MCVCVLFDFIDACGALPVNSLAVWLLFVAYSSHAAVSLLCLCSLPYKLSTIKVQLLHPVAVLYTVQWTMIGYGLHRTAHL